MQSQTAKDACIDLGLTFEEIQEIFPVLKEKMVSTNPTSDAFMIKHPNFIEWDLACRYLTLSDTVQRACSKFMNWQIAVRFQQIPRDVLEANMEKMDWNNILQYQKLEVEFLNNYIELMTPTSMNLIFRYQSPPLTWLRDRLRDAQRHSDELYKSLLKTVAQYQEISEPFIAMFINDMNIHTLLAHQTISTNFIRDHKDTFNMNLVMQYQTLDADFIREFYDTLDRTHLIQTQIIPVDILAEHPDHFTIEQLCRYQPVTMELLETVQAITDETIKSQCRDMFVSRYVQINKTYKPFVHTGDIPANVERYMENMINEMDMWTNISQKQLGEDFIAKYNKHISLIHVFSNKESTFTESVITKLAENGRTLDVIEMYVFMFYQGKNTSQAFKDQHVDALDWWKFSNLIENIPSSLQNETNMSFFKTIVGQNTDFNHMVRHEKLPEWFMDMFASYLDWWKIPHYQLNLSTEFVIRHMSEQPLIDIEQVCIYQTLTAEFIRQYADFLPWDTVSHWQPLTIDIVKEFYNYIQIDELESNKHINPILKEEIIKTINELKAVPVMDEEDDAIETPVETPMETDTIVSHTEQIEPSANAIPIEEIDNITLGGTPNP